MVDLKVGIAGFGTIGRAVGKVLDEGIPGLSLHAVCSGDQNKAKHYLADFISRPLVVDTTELAECCDVIVECAPTEVFLSIAEPALRMGRTLVTVSGAAILNHPEIVTLADKHHAKIILASGALMSMDAMRAAAEGTIYSVTMLTRKPPASLIKADYVKQNHPDLLQITRPLQIFKGSAREGAELFPANVNVAAALGLAGIGANRTQLEIWADPDITRNTHHISVDADSASFNFTIENIPTEENPGTGKITALSMIATLRSLTAPLRVGT
ncbi:MAG: aspartate dehydrogenase [Pseudomonadales bacterium]